MNLKQASILVIDDNKDVLTAVRLLLKSEVRNIVTDTNPDNIRRLMSENNFDIILLDMNFASSVNTGNEGLFWLREIKKYHPKAKVIMITAYADIDLAVRSLKEGAADFLVKPWHNEALVKMLNEAIEKRENVDQTKKRSKSEELEIIGESEAMQTLFRKLEKIAPTDANVLIIGENGTGKDLLAQAICFASLRKDKAFVKVDVGALTETLFESELFGHKKGAFTDAREDRTGLIEASNGGTLFLDEIGNISLQQQAKLLTVLQNRQIVRLGTNVPIPIDIRLISATNLPFAELANEQKFRKDLIYRINTVEILVPPLRERGNDIILLAERFLQIYSTKYLKPSMQLSRQAIDKLLQHKYPGNVRELQYAVERAVIMSEGEELKASDMLFSPLEHNQIQYVSTPKTGNLEDLERTTIMATIDKYNGNISKAAKELGLTRAALYRRLEKYGI